MKRLLAVGGLIGVGVVLLTGCVSNFKEQDAVSLSEQNLPSLNASQDTSQVLDDLKNSVQTLIAARSCIETGTCAVDISSIEQEIKQAFGYTRDVLRQLLNSSILTAIETELQSKRTTLNINGVFKNTRFQQLLNELGFTNKDIKVIKSFLKKNKKSIEITMQGKNATQIIQEVIDAITTSMNKINPASSGMSPQITWYWGNLRPALRNAGRWFVSCMGQAAWASTLGIVYGTYDYINYGWPRADTLVHVYIGLKDTISTCTDESYWRLNR